jgi:alkanesulfonate monooxygenase SsuD/methylene tetrahydromethanopterin reductase-like flavin-dependent oxidoreductase (luciferase family)
MKVDGGLGFDLTKVPQAAKELEAAGYAGAWTAETAHDPFFPLLLGAEHTSTLEVGTSIAVAFARNPMTLANIGWDLQAYSQGRFMFGLGFQIKQHKALLYGVEPPRSTYARNDSCHARNLGLLAERNPTELPW